MSCKKKITPAKEIGKTRVLLDKYTSLFNVFFESCYVWRKKWIRFERTRFEFVIWLSEGDSSNIGRFSNKSFGFWPRLSNMFNIRSTAGADAGVPGGGGGGADLGRVLGERAAAEDVRAGRRLVEGTGLRV